MPEETEEERIQRLQREVKQNLKDTIDQMLIRSYELSELDGSDPYEISLIIHGRMEN